MNQKVRELEDTFQSKNGNGCEASSSSSEELKDPKKIRKLELAKKQHQELKTKKVCTFFFGSLFYSFSLLFN